MSFRPEESMKLEGLSVVTGIAKSEDVNSKCPDLTFGQEVLSPGKDQLKTQRSYQTEVVAKLDSGND